MTDKTPLVLLPAYLATDTLWRDQIEGLSDIAQIQVGDLTRHDSIAGMAAAVLAEAPERFALAGLSLGGYTAFEILRTAPERVIRLALVSTTARDDTPEVLGVRQSQVELVRSGHFDDVIEPFPAMIQNPESPFAPAVRETIQAMSREVGPGGLINQQLAMMSRPDSRPGLSAIACPTVVVCGRQDPRAPLEHSEEIAASIPGAKLVIIENCGHFSAIDQPAAVTAALRAWLLS